MTGILNRCLFVIGRQRSGTTVLREALASHPRIHDLGELLHEQKPGGFYAELGARLAETASAGLHERWFDILVATIHRLAPPEDDKVLLVDIKYNGALNFGSLFVGPTMVNTLIHKLSRHSPTVIHVMRRNKLSLLTSVEMARKTGQWRLKHGQERQLAQIALDLRTLPARIAAEEALDAYFATQLAAIGARIPVVYEDMFMPDGTFAKGCFMQVAHRFAIDPAFDFTPRLARQSVPLSAALANFTPVCALIDSMVGAGSLSPEYRTYLRT